MLAPLASTRARVVALEMQILDAERALLSLRLEQTLAQERLDSYKYPILTLPNELTSEIFTQFIPPYPLCPALNGPSSPNILTQICRKWRQVAMATPALWRGIQLCVPRGPPLVRRDQTLENWLARSHRQSISVEILETKHWVWPQTFREICAQSARLEYLKLDIFPDLPRLGPMPLLRHLDLHIRSHPSDITPFEDVPRLRSVVLNKIAANHIILPWAQLTSLTLQFMYLRACVPILAQTPRLTHCELSILDAYTDRPTSAPITLPRLEVLILKAAIDHEANVCIDDTFIVPALQRLQVPEPFLEPIPIAALTRFISRAGCTLREVRIMGDRVFSDASYRGTWPSESIPTFVFDGPCIGDLITEDTDTEGDSAIP
ncbi:hypothetical protein C8R46DRAFT_1349173 [Mycena filopes]|nr:hypothetical protein C8R46DRAFT_1349173 [Mycena filopes]